MEKVKGGGVRSIMEKELDGQVSKLIGSYVEAVDKNITKEQKGKDYLLFKKKLNSRQAAEIIERVRNIGGLEWIFNVSLDISNDWIRKTEEEIRNIAYEKIARKAGIHKKEIKTIFGDSAYGIFGVEEEGRLFSKHPYDYVDAVLNDRAKGKRPAVEIVNLGLYCAFVKCQGIDDKFTIDPDNKFVMLELPHTWSFVEVPIKHYNWKERRVYELRVEKISDMPESLPKSQREKAKEYEDLLVEKLKSV